MSESCENEDLLFLCGLGLLSRLSYIFIYRQLRLLEGCFLCCVEMLEMNLYQT